MARNELSPHKENFSFTAPEAMSVLLVGDFTHWQGHPRSMRKGPDGIWSTSIDLTPGKHTYRFIVDGEWRDDPECAIHIPNPYGSEDMVRQVT
jgi:1,4-alpha-glucan branching enzyme